VCVHEGVIYNCLSLSENVLALDKWIPASCSLWN